jgi:hypothetical protein
MALNDAAVVTPAVGYIYVAPVDTASPTPAEIEAFNPTTGLSGWTQLGHTSRDDLPVFGFDGGETEVRGTWQNASFKRVTTEVAQDFVTFNALQIDETVLMYYYGETSPGSTLGKFDVNNAATSGIDVALVIVIVDGSTNVGFHASKGTMGREDSIELAVDEFMAVPLRYDILKSTGKPLFSWLSYDTGVNLT